jgi:hypothetical protein
MHPHDLKALLDRLDSGDEPLSPHELMALIAAGRGLPDPRLPRQPRPSLRKKPRKSPAAYRVRVDLDNARPPIWRRLDLRSDLTLAQMHLAIQAAFGWWDYHLHRFALGGSVFDRDAELFLCPYDVEEGEDDGVPAATVRLDETLAEPGDELRYCYDYGDSWELTLRLESVHDLGEGLIARCVGGRRAAPPEDCGGPRDAEDLAEVLDDPAHFDLAEVNEALTDPFIGLRTLGLSVDLVDLLTRLRGTDVSDQLVAKAFFLTGSADLSTPEQRATALGPLRWFLDHVGDDGLTLTAAGYLKPVDVTAAAAVVPSGADCIGAKNREIDTYPVLHFRERLQRLGLLRKAKGRLTLTKTGRAVRRDPDALLAHLATRLPLGKPGSFDHEAGLLYLLVVAADQGEPDLDLVTSALVQRNWHAGPHPVDRRQVDAVLRDLTGLLSDLDLGPRPGGLLAPRRPPSAVARDLARAALRT